MFVEYSISKYFAKRGPFRNRARNKKFKRKAEARAVLKTCFPTFFLSKEDKTPMYIQMAIATGDAQLISVSPIKLKKITVIKSGKAKHTNNKCDKFLFDEGKTFF